MSRMDGGSGWLCGARTVGGYDMRSENGLTRV